MPDVKEVKNWFDETFATVKQSERKEEITMSENLIDEVNAISIKSHETNALQTWNYEDKQIRTIKMDDEMWFVAKDVATVLNYSNPRDAVSRHVDEEDKGVVKHDTLGGVQNLAIINESGVYALIFGSKLPTAKNVKKWFGEMLATVKPSERKEEFAMNENLIDEIDEIESQKIEDYSEKADASKNSLQLWNYEDNNVRTIEMDGEMWFVAKDVAQILGYAKPRNAIIAHVDEEDKKDAPIQGDLGGTQMMNIINESGVYALIFGSKLPNAKKFKRWVTSVVLAVCSQARCIYSGAGNTL